MDLESFNRGLRQLTSTEALLRWPLPGLALVRRLYESFGVSVQCLSHSVSSSLVEGYEKWVSRT